MKPTTGSTPPYTDDQRREAAEWWVKIRGGGEVPNDTLQEWLRWLAHEEGNRQAFEAISNTWNDASMALADLTPSKEELQSDRYDGEHPVRTWLQRQPHARQRGYSAQSINRLRPWFTPWASLAALLVLALGGYVALTLRGHFNSSDEFVTRTGEQLEISLNDGSHVWLGAKSRLLVQYTARQRGVRLEVGEAYFSVKKDPSRPFMVRADNREITAVGTGFDVRQAAGRVTVEVSEGVVSVASNAAPNSLNNSVRVASGQELTMDAKKSLGDATVVQSANPGERARWRQGMLIYRDEPLRVVVSDVARYSDLDLEIADEAVGNLRFSGVVYKSAVDEWASALPESFPVKLVNVDGRLKLIAR